MKPVTGSPLMALNPYALCPCGSGKKIKFCCGDLAGDMEKVLRMVEGDQRAAAVRHLERLLQKNPGRVSLLDLKSAVELEIGWYDQAKITVDEYVAADPQNPNAWARRAALLSIHGDVPTAVDALQSAISYSDDPPYSSVILMAVRLMGQAFAESGNVLAAMAHFSLYSDVSPDRDLEGTRELIRLTRELPIPELMKGPFELRRDSADPVLAGNFERVHQTAHRGAWREALAQLDALHARAADDAAILYNRTLLRSYLGRHDETVAGLREYAHRPDVPHDDAVELLALAQLIDFDEDTDRIKGKTLAFAIDETQRLVDKFRRHDRVVRMERPYAFWTSRDEGPSPEAAFFLLDRPQPDNWPDVSLSDVPRVLASVELYGRETDRSARAVVHLTQDSEYESKLAAARELLEAGDAAPAEESDDTSFSPMANFTAYHSYVPQSIPVKAQLKIVEESRLRAILDIWPQARQSALGGKSPAELAEDPARKLELEAAVLRLFETQIPARLWQRAEPIFEKLGVEPLPRSLDPQEIPADRMTFVRLRRVDATKLPDDQLAGLALQAAIVDAAYATAHLAPELLRRPELHAIVNLYTVCHTAVAEAVDFESAAAFLDDARRLVSPELIPAGIWDVLELEAALDFLQEERITDLFRRASEQANLNEDVARAFVRVLAQRGLITPDGRLRVPPPAQGAAQPGLAVPETATEPPKIWTPEAEAAQQGKGKIWMPS